MVTFSTQGSDVSQLTRTKITQYDMLQLHSQFSYLVNPLCVSTKQQIIRGLNLFISCQTSMSFTFFCFHVRPVFFLFHLDYEERKKNYVDNFLNFSCSFQGDLAIRFSWISYDTEKKQFDNSVLFPIPFFQIAG